MGYSDGRARRIACYRVMLSDAGDVTDWASGKCSEFCPGMVWI